MLANFSGTDLVRASFLGATLRGTIFVNANLIDAKFLGARLEVAEIFNAQQKSTGKSIPVMFNGAVLQGTDFSRATISGANFTDSVQFGTVWNHAKIENCTGIVG